MATLTIRRVAPEVRDNIRIAAAARGRSMEAEVRALLEREFMASGLDAPLLAFGESARRATDGKGLDIPKREEAVIIDLADQGK